MRQNVKMADFKWFKRQLSTILLTSICTTEVQRVTALHPQEAVMRTFYLDAPHTRQVTDDFVNRNVSKLHLF